METFAKFYKDLLNGHELAAKRMVVFDTMNVLYGVSEQDKSNKTNENRPVLHFLYLLPLVRFFVKRGHPVNLVIKYKTATSSKQNLMVWKVLSQFELFTIVPSLVHDDVVALTIARDNCGAIISRDHFRDHLRLLPNLGDAARRRIDFHCSVNKGFYENSYGDLIYNVDFVMQHSIKAEQLFSFYGDNDYDLVHKSCWPTGLCRDVVKTLDMLIYEFGGCEKPTKWEFSNDMNASSNFINSSSLDKDSQKKIEDLFLDFKEEKCTNIKISNDEKSRTCTFEASRGSTRGSDSEGEVTIPLSSLNGDAFVSSSSSPTVTRVLFRGASNAEQKEYLYSTLKDELQLDGKLLYKVLYNAKELDRNHLVDTYFQLVNLSNSHQDSLNI